MSSFHFQPASSRLKGKIFTLLGFRDHKALIVREYNNLNNVLVSHFLHFEESKIYIHLA